MKRWRPILACLLFLVAAGPVRGQVTPEKEEAFVYGVHALTPGGMEGNFAPPSVDRLYLLAGRDSVLSPRRTKIYFWPITNEYRAAWSELNEQVEGTLEIYQGGRQVAEVERTAYTIQYTVTEGNPDPQVYVGEEARAAHERFTASQEAYQQSVRDYEKARTRWRETVHELRQEGEVSEEALPPYPERPEPFNLYTTGLSYGFPIDLAAGTYRLQVRLPDGRIQPQSERELVVFGPRRTAVGYSVIPEARWTMEEKLTDPSDAILGQTGSVFYLQPHLMEEYPSLAYEHLLNPQYPGDARGAEWRWIMGEKLAAGPMEIRRAGQTVETVRSIPYKVEQNPGADLGYEINPAASSEDRSRPPDFSAYRIALDEQLPAYRLRLLTEDGTVVRGSERQVRALPPARLRPLLLLPLLPLLLGAFVFFVRSRRTVPVNTGA